MCDRICHTTMLICKSKWGKISSYNRNRYSHERRGRPWQKTFHSKIIMIVMSTTGIQPSSSPDAKMGKRSGATGLFLTLSRPHRNISMIIAKTNCRSQGQWRDALRVGEKMIIIHRKDAESAEDLLFFSLSAERPESKKTSSLRCFLFILHGLCLFICTVCAPKRLAFPLPSSQRQRKKLLSLRPLRLERSPAGRDASTGG